MAWAEKMSSGRWRGRYYDQDGKVRSVTDGGRGYAYKTDAREAAEDEASKSRRQAAIDTGTQSARIPWGQLYDLYAEKRRRKDTETAATERYLVDLYIYPRWGDVAAYKIKRKQIQSWIKNDIAPGKKPSYVHRIYQAFAAPLNWAVDEDMMDASPCTKIELPKITKEPKPYVDDDYLAAIRDHLNARTMRALEFQFETGLRPGELGGLHIHRIDRRLRLLYVADVYVSRPLVIRPHAKNGKIEEIPLTARALEILDEVLDGRDHKRGCGLAHTDGRKCPSDVVFRTARDDVPLNPRNYYGLLRLAASNAQLDFRPPYAGRRGAATRAAESGLSIFDLAAFLRHDPSQTARYVQRGPAFYDRVRAALGDPPQLTVVEGARGARRGAGGDNQPATAENIGGPEPVAGDG